MLLAPGNDRSGVRLDVLVGAGVDRGEGYVLGQRRAVHRLEEVAPGREIVEGGPAGERRRHRRLLDAVLRRDERHHARDVLVAAERLDVVARDEPAGALGEDVDLGLTGVGTDLIDDVGEALGVLEQVAAEEIWRLVHHRDEAVALEPRLDGVEPLGRDRHASDEEHHARLLERARPRLELADDALVLVLREEVVARNTRESSCRRAADRRSSC
jgi:hypothetical protein